MSFDAVPSLLIKRNSERDDNFSSSLDGRQSKKLDNKKTPRLSADESNGATITTTTTTAAATNLNSYQKAFLSKYGSMPSAEPSGGIKWNKTAGMTASVSSSSASTSASATPPGVLPRTSNPKPETDTTMKERREDCGNNQLPRQTLVEAAAASARKTEAANASKPRKAINPSLGGGKWTKAEDAQLCQAVKAVGPKNWRRISAEFLQGRRSDVQCLHRWQKVLRPGLVKGPWTESEDAIIIASSVTA